LQADAEEGQEAPAAHPPKLATGPSFNGEFQEYLSSWMTAQVSILTNFLNGNYS